KKIPDLDTLAAMRQADDNFIVITLRGIGEMERQNAASRVTLANELDEFGLPRAFVTIQPTAADGELWQAMDQAADEPALVLANGLDYEVLTAGGFQPIAAGVAAATALPFVNRRDGLGTTHHEAGTLALGEDAAASVLNPDARFHYVTNAYACGPAVFPQT